MVLFQQPREQRMARAFFIQAPPLKTGRTKRKSGPNAPLRLPKHEHYKASVFYYWWAFLRLNEAYIKTCENGGRGKHAKLYDDFGDVRGDDFWAWWKTHTHLFSEPPVAQVTAITDVSAYVSKPNTILIDVPLDKKLLLRMRQVRRILEDKMEKASYRMSESHAQYKVSGKPVVAALSSYLRAWELRQQYPKLPYADVYEIVRGRPVDIEAALKPKPRVKKLSGTVDFQKNVPLTQMGYRYVRFADEIISNVVKGQFPVFTKVVRKKGEKAD